MDFTSSDVVLINGAAGGIGRATVAAFLDRGAFVVGLDIKDSVGSVAGDRYLGLRVDLKDRNGTAQAIEAAERQLGADKHLRAVVAISGGANAQEVQADHFTDTPIKAVEATLWENYLAQHQFAQLCWPWLVRSGPVDRCFTFTGSINAEEGYRLPSYAAAKAALVGLMRSLAATEGPLGIRVNVLSPGAVRTEWWRSQPEAEWPTLQRAQEVSEEQMADATPLRRIAEPEDVAQMYVAIARQPHLTGTEIRLDGGQRYEQTLIDTTVHAAETLDARAQRFSARVKD